MSSHGQKGPKAFRRDHAGGAVRGRRGGHGEERGAPEPANPQRPDRGGGEGPFWVTGLHPVEELLSSKLQRPRSVLLSSSLPPAERTALEALARRAGVPASVHPPEEIRRRTGDREHAAVAAESEPFAWADLDEWLPALPAEAAAFLLDGVTDPQNLGSILRSARAFGFAGVVVPKDRSCPVTGAVYRASAGAAAHVPLVRVPNLARAVERLQEGRFWVYAAEGGGETELAAFRPPPRVGLVLGSEGGGVRRLVRERCDGSLRIAMAPGAESLNVGVAAGIFAWSVRKALTGS